MRRPSYVSWPLWKTLSLGLFVGGSISLMSWLFKFLWEAGRYAGFNSTPPHSLLLLCGICSQGVGSWCILCGIASLGNSSEKMQASTAGLEIY